jgi:hypothetical protein
MSQKTTGFVTNNNMFIVPHPPYPPDFFSQIENENGRDNVLKQCLTSKGNRKRYSTALRKMTSTVLLKCGRNNGITVYVLKDTVLKEMAAKIE